MGRRAQRVSYEEKLEISEMALAGKSDPQVAKAMDRSVHTIRKWRRQFAKYGKTGLTIKMGRPASGVLGSYPEELRTAILQMRNAHPGWGPKTILMEFQQDSFWSKRTLPSRSRIAAFLKQEGLTRQYQRHIDLPEPERKNIEKPHEEWEMDAQASMRIKGLSGRTSVIHIIDVFSRLKIESCPRLSCRKPATKDYFLALRKAFTQFGLPERISLDRDTVFIDNTLTSPFPTRIHLWLIALGVEVSFTRKRRPTDHAQVERSHQTMTAQVIQGQEWSSESEFWKALDCRRDRLNHHFPMHVLGDRAPLEAYPDATSSGRAYRPEWEEKLLSLERLFDYLAKGRWIRSSNDSGSFRIGGFHYYIGKQWLSREFEITFDPETAAFIMQPDNDDEPFSVPAKALTKADLMGDLDMLLNLPAYQLAFPFTREAHHCLSLAQVLAGTTL